MNLDKIFDDALIETQKFLESNETCKTYQGMDASMPAFVTLSQNILKNYHAELAKKLKSNGIEIGRASCRERV